MIARVLVFVFAIGAMPGATLGPQRCRLVLLQRQFRNPSPGFYDREFSRERSWKPRHESARSKLE